MEYHRFREIVQQVADSTRKKHVIAKSGITREGWTYWPLVRAEDGLVYDVVSPR